MATSGGGVDSDTLSVWLLDERFDRFAVIIYSHRCATHVSRAVELIDQDLASQAGRRQSIHIDFRGGGGGQLQTGNASSRVCLSD